MHLDRGQPGGLGADRRRARGQRVRCGDDERRAERRCGSGGTILVAGQTYSVSQPAAPTTSPGCTFSVSPDSESFPDNGGAGSVRVQASGPTCAWTAVSNAQWISVATPRHRSGNPRYTLTPNPAPLAPAR